MADKWVSQQRKYCELCNCWFADNRISIENHEKGATHQANVERDLNRTRKKKQDQVVADKRLLSEMQRIEAAALRSFEEDAKRDPFARDEYERLMQAKNKKL